MVCSITNLLTRDRVTAVLAGSIESHPLTVLTAPMGYGKTTAARELAALSTSRAYFATVPQGAHNARYVWELLCAQLAAQGLEGARELQRAGFPEDALGMRRVIDFCLNYKEHMLLVLDDYHLATDQALDGVLETLIRLEMEGFRILLLSRERPRLPLEELRMKGLAECFDGGLLVFTEDEAIDFFRLGGESDRAAASEAWRQCEGWAAALWLSLQSRLAGGRIVPSLDMNRLLSETVFPACSHREQRLLLSLSFMDSFTPWQAAEISGDKEAPRLLRDLQNKNALVSYAPSTDNYQIHGIFRSFLVNLFDETPDRPEEPEAGNSVPENLVLDKGALRRRAGEWFAAHGDPVRAMRFFSAAGQPRDFTRMLDLCARPDGAVMIGLDPQNLPPLLLALPWPARLAHPVGWLAFVYNLLTMVDPEQAIPLLLETGERLSAESSFSEPERKRLAGEMEMIRSVTYFNDIRAMLASWGRAVKLLGGRPSNIHLPNHIWAMGSPHASYMYLREPGEYAALDATIAENFTTYQKASGGGGAGAPELCRAERFLEMGLFGRVEPLVMKAIFKGQTQTQPTTLIVAHFALARLRLARGQKEEAQALLRNLEPGVAAAGNTFLDRLLDLARGYVGTTIGEAATVQAWLEQGQSLTGRAQPQARTFALIIFGKALLAAGRWAELEALSEDLENRLATGRNLFGRIHLLALRAGAVWRLYGRDKALPVLRRAVELARPDGLITPLAEYAPHLSPLWRRLGDLEPDDEFGQKILKTSGRYAAGGGPLSLKERTLLELVEQGWPDKEISSRLGLSPKTVRNLLSRLYAKLGVANRLQAVRLWRELSTAPKSRTNDDPDGSGM